MSPTNVGCDSVIAVCVLCLGHASDFKVPLVPDKLHAGCFYTCRSNCPVENSDFQSTRHKKKTTVVVML